MALARVREPLARAVGTASTGRFPLSLDMALCVSLHIGLLFPLAPYLSLISQTSTLVFKTFHLHLPYSFHHYHHHHQQCTSLTSSFQLSSPSWVPSLSPTPQTTTTAPSTPLAPPSPSPPAGPPRLSPQPSSRPSQSQQPEQAQAPGSILQPRALS